MNPHSAPGPALQAKTDRPTMGRGVLVVDDDMMVRDTLAMQLKSDGTCVATASSIDAAQAALGADPEITVVVCDILLADESGFDLADMLTELRPESLATEVVFITGNTNGDSAIGALRHRAFDLIYKPVRQAELVARVGDAHLAATLRRQRQAMLDQVESRLAEGEALKQQLMAALHSAEDQNRALEDRAGAARSDLLAVIAHELKTPLIPIVGLSDIMLAGSDPNPDEVREYAVLIRDGGERLEAIIDRTLTYLDAERRHAQEEKSDFAVSDLIFAALRNRSQPDGESTPDIEIDCPTVLRAWGAYVLLAEALGELVDNAIKASPHGESVRVAARETDSGGIAVDISDYGPGLPDLVREKIGVPFLQGDTSLTRRWPGVGIGLARAKKIAQLNGGDIEFAGTLACRGTTVSIVMLSRPR